MSRRLFQPLFPRWPEDEVPIGHVTNGVHVPTWDSAAADALWTETLRKGALAGDDGDARAGHPPRVRRQSSGHFRTAASESLVDYVRERLSPAAGRLGRAAGGCPRPPGSCFDPDALTLGFARRFATYKRPNLLLHDPTAAAPPADRSASARCSSIIAGKAHPADQAGQALIREWIQFIRQPRGPRPHVVFLADYDMLLTEHLVQGVDVWINTPRRPWEASGTSGMKVLVNGGLNLSELDGWWAEAYTPRSAGRWGTASEHGDDPGVGRGRGRGALRPARARGGARSSTPATSGAFPRPGSRGCARAWRA